jgi:methyl-accepting chemotaxis protein
MSIVHYAGIILLPLNAFLLTDNLYAQILQVVVAVVIVIHEFDENINGRRLSKNIIDKLHNIGKGEVNIEINTDMASEFDEIKEVISQLEKEDASYHEEEEFIKIAKTTIENVKMGHYDQTIDISTSNPLLEEFKDDVNSMIISTKRHFESVNKILEKYAVNDFRDKLVLHNIGQNGVFKILSDDINKLRDVITQTLIENKSDGMTLQISADELLENVNQLNHTSENATASLEETTLAIEEMNQNISSNTKNVIQMASFANDVTKFAADGQDLANQTTQSMDKINEEVTAISDSISVIDQIAFQTNILSLNAAVEAATAGETGKGFAVVAGEVRNLASRSSEAANEIKALVENATEKANVGKNISDKMIQGYDKLNNSISQTINLISDVEKSTKEQQESIGQINSSLTSLETQTKHNNSIASHTQQIAVKTDNIARDMLKLVDDKEFEGKERVTARK